ncbi:peptidyl-prolyl cis-trans isomerase [Flavobacterium sp. MK4S-17]|uniref:peptidylprolyl isomerase n=1 Tax=Flavobacterium sp. MK4S-17 TaxID=2543737 RepID=UPI00135B5D1B|nr:peptidylprolyl isomerase [Flavobacterium sp. MK4S-17]
MFKGALLLLGAALLLSCNNTGNETDTKAVARVNNSYLYNEDLQNLVPAGTPKEDSIAIVKSYIDHWASQKLLYDAAEINLNKEKQEEFNNLIRQYKVDLYTSAYIEEIVKRSVDTLVTEEELKAYYTANKDNFRTTSPLVKLKYIRLDKDYPKFAAIKSKFLSGRKADVKSLNNIAIQFKSYAFNDTTWVDVNEVYRKLPFITPENFDKYVSSGISYQYPDSTNVYIVKIKKVLEKNQVSPFELIKPTLTQLIINNRKLELIKKFEKEITDDAIKNRKYEIYK